MKIVFIIYFLLISFNNLILISTQDDDTLESAEVQVKQPFEPDASWTKGPSEKAEEPFTIISDVSEEVPEVQNIISDVLEEVPEVQPEETSTAPLPVEDSIKNETLGNKTGGAKNETDSKISCTPRALADGQIPSVVVVNMTSLTENLNPRGSTSAAGECALVFFYSPWCPFSERAAPHFTALARAFPHISLYAVDALAHSNLQMKYGLVAVPTVLLFHNGRAIAKFNDSVPTLSKMSIFVSRITGAASLKGVEVEESDESPEWFPPVQPRSDPVLWLAWSFTLACGAFFFGRSALCHRLVDSLLNAWREAQHEHEE